MAKPRAYEAKRTPATDALVNAVERELVWLNQQRQQLQLVFEGNINRLAAMERDRASIPDGMLYDHASKAWVTKPSEPPPTPLP